jgi:hypothetical protein
MTIDCHIRVTQERDILRLEAVATGRQPARGQYRLEWFKQNSIGTSQNVQSGAVDLEPNRDDLWQLLSWTGRRPAISGRI